MLRRSPLQISPLNEARKVKTFGLSFFKNPPYHGIMKPSVVENEGPSVVHVIIKAPTFSEAEVAFAKYMMDYSPNGYGTSEVDRFTDEDGLATIKVWRLASCE